MTSIHRIRACVGAALAIATAFAPIAQAQAVLSEAQLIDWVLETNPALASREAAAVSARFRIPPAGALDDPTLSYGTAPRTAGSGGLNQRVEISQRLPWFGTRDTREEIARAEAGIAAGELASAQLSVVAEARALHAEWRFVDESLAIYHAVESLLDELIATVGSRYAVGRALRQEVLQVEVERADLESEELRLLQQQVAVRARINALLNRAPDEPLPRAAPLAGMDAPPDLDVLTSLALEQHPELARLDAGLAADRGRVALAEKAFFPDFQVGVGYNSLWDETDKRTVIGVTINVPLDRSKRRATLNAARAEENRMQWALAERRAELLAELARARAEVVEAQQSVTLHQDRLVPLAAEFLSAAITDYQSGTGAFLNVITAEQRKLATDLALARARADYASRWAELERWAGVPLAPLPTTTRGARQ